MKLANDLQMTWSTLSPPAFLISPCQGAAWWTTNFHNTTSKFPANLGLINELKNMTACIFKDIFKSIVFETLKK